MSQMRIHAVQAVGDDSYLVTFLADDGAARAYVFGVTDALGVPGVTWPEEFERDIELHMSQARPLVDVLTALHASRQVGLEIT